MIGCVSFNGDPWCSGPASPPKPRSMSRVGHSKARSLLVRHLCHGFTWFHGDMVCLNHGSQTELPGKHWTCPSHILNIQAEMICTSSFSVQQSFSLSFEQRSLPWKASTVAKSIPLRPPWRFAPKAHAFCHLEKVTL